MIVDFITHIGRSILGELVGDEVFPLAAHSPPLSAAFVIARWKYRVHWQMIRYPVAPHKKIRMIFVVKHVIPDHPHQISVW